jgi:hypothetical protein
MEAKIRDKGEVRQFAHPQLVAYTGMLELN